MAKLPGMTQQQKGFRKRNVPAASTALAEVTGTRDRLAAHSHSWLQTAPFPKLGSKEHAGFHCPEQTELCSLQITPVPGFGMLKPAADFTQTWTVPTWGVLPVLSSLSQPRARLCWHTGLRSW